MTTPQQVVIGGAIVIAHEVKSLVEDSDITYSIQQAEKKANEDEDNELCAKCQNDVRTVQMPVIIYKNLATMATQWLINRFRKQDLNWHLVRVRLNGRWEYNGCDIAGATFFLGSSVANLGWNVHVDAEVLSSQDHAPSGCEPCCEQSVAIAWKVDVKIDPPLQSTRFHVAFPYMYGNGSDKGFYWT